MIGDTMETDILGGVQLGFHTVLVLSGGTKAEDLERSAYRPDMVVDSLANLVDVLHQNDWTYPWIGVERPIMKERPAKTAQRRAVKYATLPTE